MKNYKIMFISNNYHRVIDFIQSALVSNDEKYFDRKY